MSESGDPQDGEFEKRTRALLEESVTHIDGRVRSRLNQARQAALGELAARQPAWRGRAAVPVGLATAAAVTLVAVLAWQQRTPQIVPDDAADMELLADGEAFELLENDDDFYEWALSQEAGG